MATDAFNQWLRPEMGARGVEVMSTISRLTIPNHRNVASARGQLTGEHQSTGVVSNFKNATVTSRTHIHSGREHVDDVTTFIATYRCKGSGLAVHGHTAAYQRRGLNCLGAGQISR